MGSAPAQGKDRQHNNRNYGNEDVSRLDVRVVTEKAENRQDICEKHEHNKYRMTVSARYNYVSLTIVTVVKKKHLSITVMLIAIETSADRHLELL